MLAREPFAGPAAELLSRVDSGELSGLICATTVTTIHYLATKVVGKARAKSEIRKLLSLLEVAAVNRSVLEEALESRIADFEDAVLSAAAKEADAHVIVTRNLKDFIGSSMRVYSPDETLAQLKAAKRNGN